MIVSKKNIPIKGDSVVKVIANKERTLAQIVFESGKKVSISLEPSEYGIQSKQSSKVSESKKINSLTKNSPEDQNYKNKVLQTLAKMDGVSVEEIQSKISSPSTNSIILNETSDTTSDDWKEKAQQALEKSQNRATRLAEELSRSSGGKLETAFVGGVNTIPMK